MILPLLTVPALGAIGFYAYVRRLSGEDLSQYDRDVTPFARAQPSEGLSNLNVYLKEMFGADPVAGNSTSGWEGKRERFDQAGLARDYADIEFRDATITVDGREIHGRWTLAPGYDAGRRLLYLHGGAFTVGSDISHRPLTAQLARRTGMAVFAPNYRLMPENTRRNTIEDARAAYDWICDHGPDRESAPKKLALAGDSAGGNLALMLGNWARGNAARQADAIVAFSPTTDATLSSPSMKDNLDRDIMLEPLLRPIVKAPRAMLLPMMRKHYGMSPSHPDQSPVFDDLSNLPPTLVQASADEMLRDDAIRFAGKAEAAGSPVTLQLWDGGLPHVWQIFDDHIPEALDALDEVERFLAQHV